MLKKEEIQIIRRDTIRILRRVLTMREQKNDSVLQYNEAAFAAAGDYIIPVIKLQPVEEKRFGKYGRMRRVFLQ